MTKKKKENLVKWIALIGFAGYLIYSTKKVTGSSKAFGEVPDGWNASVDPDLAVDMLMIPLGINPVLKPILRAGARKITKKLNSKYGINEHRGGKNYA